MSTATHRGPSPPVLPGICPAPSLGLFYLDVRSRRLYLLNDTSRQLHAEGIPVLGNEASLAQLRSPTGEDVPADELPLRAAAVGRPVEASYVLSRPPQPDCLLQWSAAPLRDGEGRVTAVLAAVASSPPPPDWHALAGLAHDLRTPLQALRLLTTALGQGEPARPERAEDLGRLQSAAERALQVSGDLLEWCRDPAQGGRRVEPAWFALEPFLSRLAQEHLGAAGRKGVTLGADLAEALGWEACTDRVRLGRILANLLSNAIRYTAPGGEVRLAATWREEAGARALALEVADTGAGISPEEHESIFQPFERGTAGKGDSSGGSGLGLSVVDRLVVELGLRREVASEHGRGSDFRVLLPQTLLRVTV